MAATIKHGTGISMLDRGTISSRPGLCTISITLFLLILMASAGARPANQLARADRDNLWTADMQEFVPCSIRDSRYVNSSGIQDGNLTMDGTGNVFIHNGTSRLYRLRDDGTLMVAFELSEGRIVSFSVLGAAAWIVFSNGEVWRRTGMESRLEFNVVHEAGLESKVDVVDAVVVNDGLMHFLLRDDSPLNRVGIIVSYSEGEVSVHDLSKWELEGAPLDLHSITSSTGGWLAAGIANGLGGGNVILWQRCRNGVCSNHSQIDPGLGYGLYTTVSRSRGWSVEGWVFGGRGLGYHLDEYGSPSLLYRNSTNREVVPDWLDSVLSDDVLLVSGTEGWVASLVGENLEMSRLVRGDAPLVSIDYVRSLNMGYALTALGEILQFRCASTERGVFLPQILRE